LLIFSTYNSEYN